MDSPKTRCCPQDCVKYEDPFEYATMDVHAFPLTQPPPPPADYGIPEKFLAIMAKYKFSWRILQLSTPHPRRLRKKFVKEVFILKPEPPPTDEMPKRAKKMDEEIVFYSDQMSRPPLRTLMINKKLYARILDLKHRKKLRRTIDNAWDSMYNFYRMRERARRLRAKRLEHKPKKEKYDFKRTEVLAQPKKIFKPKVKKPKKKKKTFKECRECRTNMFGLSLPKNRPEPLYNKLGITKKAALKYVITPHTLKLTQPFKRFAKIKPPLELGKVQTAALLYQITSRTELLAVPRKRGEREADMEDWNPFAISRNALKYTASRRIRELAKPRKRD